MRALAALPADAERPVILVAGDGAERPRIEQLARELGVAQQLRFLGFRTDVTDLLAASDFFVLPSFTEGLPLSVLEAMAQRLAVIVTPVGGVPELIDDGVNGILVPVKDVAALTAALERLVGDAENRSRIAEAGFQRVSEQFSFDGMIDNYQDLYLSLLSRRRARVVDRLLRRQRTPAV